MQVYVPVDFFSITLDYWKLEIFTVFFLAIYPIC